MKKQILLSSILLLSCIARAEDTIQNTTPENITCESTKIENIAQENCTCENTKSETASQERISETITANIEAISENCDTVVLTFVINKDKDYNNQAWKEIVLSTADLIEFTESTNNGQGQDVNTILNKLFEFLTNNSKLTGNENKIYAGFRINLSIPKEIAETIFPQARQN